MPPRYSYTNFIHVTDVKQYSYCPAIPWIYSHVASYEPPTPSMEKGVIGADEKEEIARQLGLPKPWRIEVHLRSRELGLSGSVDIVAGSRKLVVVEVKRLKRRIRASRHFRVQLMVYALLANQTLGPVREAILYLGGEIHRYDVTQRDLQEARRLVESTRRAMDSEDPPTPSQPPSKCSYCWFRRFCPSQP